MSSNDVAIAIPAYEAAPSIADIVRRSFAQLDEVLVVDDGSTDPTLAEARTAGARTLRYPANAGKGVALRGAFDDLFGRGFRAVVTIDADGQHLPEQVPRLLETWRSGADLVIGSREHLFEAMSAVRRTSNRWSSYLISIAAGEPLADVQCGFRLYTRDLIRSTGFPEARFEAESAVVVRAIRKGFRIRTVPVELCFVDGRLASHYRPVVDSLRIFWAVCRARLGRLG